MWYGIKPDAMGILLVEDSSADAHLLMEVVAKKGYAPDIHWVSDGYHALDYVFQKGRFRDAQRPDMIVLDLNLPRISGYDVLKELKDHDVFCSIPVVILTGSRDPRDYTQCKALGADMCLAKPHLLKEYEAMIQRMMNWAFLRLVEPAGVKASVH